MRLPSYFKDFLKEIEPSPSYKKDQQTGHKTLRKRLANDEDFKEIHVNTFLQGSYKRDTAINPGKDVDIVVVTSLDPDEVTPADANKRLKKCLDKYYDNVVPQNRSFGIELSYVSLDVVLATSRHLNDERLMASFRMAAALEDATEWKEHPLLIPDRNLGEWVKTHPKKQMTWTTDKNKACGGYFVPLVKMFKWWRQEAYKLPKRPKGYVLERLAGECVDTTKRDHAEGFVALLENIVSEYEIYALADLVPYLPDPGVPEHNVAHRLEASNFKTFIDKVKDAASVARQALEEEDKKKSAALWRKVFGDKFPKAPEKKNASFPPAPVRPNKPAGFA
ncbi:MAG: nucleotidyltransferase [Proteobacteria bacterium]|nr:nucleotidyltransferase [Pseudomonadota bacterium]